MRELVYEALISFMANQKWDEAVLRVERKFRTHTMDLHPRARDFSL